eukprot:scaffold10110_cov69-Phaeocystis_antarctica.AAC.11
MPREEAKAPRTKAAEPAGLLSGAKGHLTVPNRRPTMSASPSPTAIWQIATAAHSVRQPSSPATSSTSV